jgi:hypothetical protein
MRESSLPNDSLLGASIAIGTLDFTTFLVDLDGRGIALVNAFYCAAITLTT